MGLQCISNGDAYLLLESKEKLCIRWQYTVDSSRITAEIQVGPKTTLNFVDIMVYSQEHVVSH